MNKKIASEFAIGIIVLLTIIIGGIFWLSKENQSGENQWLPQPATSVKQKPISKESQESTCIPHYYEGKTVISGWISSSDQNDGKNLIVELKSGEEKKLPAKISENAANFTVKLIDPTAAVKNKLKLATKEKPATFTIQGYAEVCSQPPLISLQEASIAFKKS
jgi:hypothetical protein